MTDYFDLDESLAEPSIKISAPRDTPCEFLTGNAGTGKTFEQVAAVQADPSYGILSATTGIASVNLGAITIHSLLKYSTTDVLRDHFISGALSRTLHSLARSYRWLIIDEASMAHYRQLDLWYRAVSMVNCYSDVDEPMGIRLVGDLAQLPPVPDAGSREVPWIFLAACWDRFRDGQRRLTKPWRQDGGPFLEALNLIRRGEGAAGAEVLAGAGAKFETQLDPDFKGTTILPRNDAVGRYNAMALDQVRGEKFVVHSRRWGKQRSEWGQSAHTKEWGVPPQVELKVGAYVMILSNARDFEYVNGDCGTIMGHGHTLGTVDEIVIKLVRTGKEVSIYPLVRGVESSEKPPDWQESNPRLKPPEDDGGWLARPHYRGRVRRYVTGQVEYFPIRLSYATTCHKSQSLTLDACQIDYRNHFFSMPGMLYTALSRCRSLGGLRLVGQKETLAKHCTIDPRIKEWL